MNFTGKGPCVTAPWDTKVDNIIFNSYALVQLCQLGHSGEARQAMVCLQPPWPGGGCPTPPPISPQNSPSCSKKLPSFLLPQIGTLLLYGIADTTDSAMSEGIAGCAREDVVNIRDTLREGHQRVEDIQVECVVS